jgi:hypothetical protein
VLQLPLQGPHPSLCQQPDQLLQRATITLGINPRILSLSFQQIETNYRLRDFLSSFPRTLLDSRFRKPAGVTSHPRHRSAYDPECHFVFRTFIPGYLRIQSIIRNCPLHADEHHSPSRLLNAPLVRPREQQQHLERKFSAQQANSEGFIGWCADSHKKREKEWDGEGRREWWSTGSGDKECIEDVVSIQSTAIQRSPCECGRYSR